MIFLLWLRYQLHRLGLEIENNVTGKRYVDVLFTRIEEQDTENTKSKSPEDEKRAASVYNVPRRHLFYIYYRVKNRFPNMRVEVEEHAYRSDSYNMKCDWTNC